jgi:hypothetical protein
MGLGTAFGGPIVGAVVVDAATSAPRRPSRSGGVLGGEQDGAEVVLAARLEDGEHLIAGL